MHHFPNHETFHIYVNFVTKIPNKNLPTTSPSTNETTSCAILKVSLAEQFVGNFHTDTFFKLFTDKSQDTGPKLHIYRDLFKFLLIDYKIIPLVFFK